MKSHDIALNRFLYFAPHCPHTPAIPDTKYEDACVNVTSPRIPNYNWANDGFHQVGLLIDPLEYFFEFLTF